MHDPTKITALVVDDLSQNRKLLSSMLRMKELEVIEADSGLQAIELFSSQSVDIVFMDVMMPEMNGFEATARIKELQGERFVPVIMVTAVEEVSGLESAVAAGADDYITKPVSLMSLHSKLHSMERIRQLHIKLYQQNQELQSIHNRIQREQEYAEEIFRSAISQHLHNIEGVEVTIQATDLFSGDLVLQAQRPDGAWCLLLGDFTGHGLPAAIGAVPVSDTFYVMSRKSMSAESILCELNDKLCRFLPVNMFMGCVMLCYLPGTATLLVWNGGMPNVLVKDAKSGKVRASVKSHDLPLGVMSKEKDEFVLTEVPLLAGDVVVAISDGIIETQNENQDYFGMDAVVDLVETNPPAVLTEKILSALDDFQGDSNQFRDDVTLVVMDSFAEL